MCCVTAAVPKVFWEPGDIRLVPGEEINPRSKRHENLYVLMAGHFLGVRCCGLVAGRLLTCGLCRQENQPHRHVRGGSENCEQTNFNFLVGSHCDLRVQAVQH